MRRFIKISLQKPELAAALLLAGLVIFFQIMSNGVFLSPANLRGILGLMPEMALVAIGVTLLMICGEFDLSVGSVFAWFLVLFKMNRLSSTWNSVQMVVTSAFMVEKIKVCLNHRPWIIN